MKHEILRARRAATRGRAGTLDRAKSNRLGRISKLSVGAGCSSSGSAAAGAAGLGSNLLDRQLFKYVWIDTNWRPT